MSEVQTEGGAETSAVEQAQTKIQEGAGQARSALRRAVSGQVESRSSQAGEQLRDVAEAFRRTGRDLQSEGSETPARMADGLSDRAERLGSYLSESSSDRLLHDVEHFGRRNPWLVIAGGVVLGLAASRLLKASSNRRFDDLRDQGYTSRLPASQWQSLPAPSSDGNP